MSSSGRVDDAESGLIVTLVEHWGLHRRMLALAQERAGLLQAA